MSDLAPTFSSQKDELEKKLSVLTRVLDGQGYESDCGSHGHRGYDGDYRFILLAATTPLSPAAWQTMGRIGNRIMMQDVEGESVTTDDLVAAMRGEITYTEKVRRCADVVSDFLLQLFNNSGGYGSIAWENSQDDQSLQTVIAKVAGWVVKCRGTATKESDESGEDGYSTSKSKLLTA